MKNGYFLRIFLGILMIALLVASVSAATIRANEQVNVTSEVKDDLYAAAGEVRLSSKVLGDALLAGGVLNITGDITEDLMAAGGQVDLQSNVGDDVRVAGGQITIESKINGDLVAAGGEITLSKSSVVNKDLVIAGGTLNILGNVNGNAKILGGTVLIDGPISGDVLIKADTLEFGQEGIIRGDLAYIGDKPKFDESKVQGNINQSSIVFPPVKTPQERVMGRFILFLTLFVTGCFFLWLGRRFTDNVTDTLKQKPGMSLLIGAIVLLATPIVAIILLITVVALPIGLFALLLYAFGIYFSLVFGSIMTGKFIFGKINMSPYLSLLLGAIIFSLIMWIPVLGGVAVFAAIFFSLGAMFIVLFSHMKKKERKRKQVKLNKV
jgi:hypothetical protein